MKRKKKGFTLLEVIIVLALITIVALVIYPFFFSSSRSFNETNIRSELQSDGQLIQDSFLNYGNQGSSIQEIVDINGSVNLNDSNSITSLTSFKLVLYSDPTKTIEYIYNSNTKELSEIKTNLNGHTGSTPPKVLSSNVESIGVSLVKESDNSVSGLVINVRLSKKNINYDISSKIVFRNKGIATS